MLLHRLSGRRCRWCPNSCRGVAVYVQMGVKQRHRSGNWAVQARFRNISLGSSKEPIGQSSRSRTVRSCHLVLHRYHEATCFVGGAEKQELCLCCLHHLSQNSSIPKLLHSRICIDPAKSEESHKVSY